MKPKPTLRSSKAQFVLANLDTNMPEKGKLMIMYLDEALAIKESANIKLETENRDLKQEVEQLRKTVHRIFESK
jgi:hypothetical protein